MRSNNAKPHSVGYFSAILWIGLKCSLDTSDPAYPVNERGFEMLGDTTGQEFRSVHSPRIAWVRLLTLGNS